MNGHHTICATVPDKSVLIAVEVGRQDDGSLVTTVHFPEGEVLKAEAGDPDVGLNEANTCLHDLAHTLVACRLGLERSPVLERTVGVRPGRSESPDGLSQFDVDVEEAAVFALQAYCHVLQGEDPRGALRNVLSAVQRALYDDAGPVMLASGVPS